MALTEIDVEKGKNYRRELGAVVDEINEQLLPTYTNALIGISVNGTTPTTHTAFNNTGETINFVRYSLGYYYAVISEDFFISNYYKTTTPSTQGTFDTVINGYIFRVFFELDGGDYLISVQTLSDSNTYIELTTAIGSNSIYWLPILYKIS
jgi:hypothetical protein